VITPLNGQLGCVRTKAFSAAPYHGP